MQDGHDLITGGDRLWVQITLGGSITAPSVVGFDDRLNGLIGEERNLHTDTAITAVQSSVAAGRAGLDPFALVVDVFLRVSQNSGRVTRSLRNVPP